MHVVGVYVECAVGIHLCGDGVALFQQHFGFQQIAVGIFRPLGNEAHECGIGTCQAVDFEVAQHHIVPDGAIAVVDADGFFVVECCTHIVLQVDARQTSHFVGIDVIGVEVDGLAAIDFCACVVFQVELCQSSEEIRLVEIGFG